jgi:hypothetical protein
VTIPPPAAPARSAGLWPLFLISAGSVGYETALTRYFAVAKWSEYGYWIISIVMAGLALAGVVVALARPALVRHSAALLTWLPVALIAAAALGFWATTLDPFNPLQLQNPTTWQPQIANIALYYVYLLPFYFLTGLYISLAFVLNDSRAGIVYAFDLTGAGAGSLLVLGLMRLLHPFVLVPALLVPLAIAAVLPGRKQGQGLLASFPAAAAAIACLAGGEALLLLDGHAAINDFKAIYAPLHVPNSRVLASLNSSRGLYTVMDDFTERVDTDISNDAGLLNLPGPPTAFGVYRDGNRIAALPKPGMLDTRYAAATLSALPYVLRPHASVLMAGPSGGFRAAEALTLGAAAVTTLEPDPVLRAAELHGVAGVPAAISDPRITVLARSPVAAAMSGHYDIVDISGDFLDEAEANTHAFTVQAIAAYLRALNPGGVVSIPVSIREFPAYAVRMLATVRAALRADGVARPQDNVVVVRSAWNVRILLRAQPWPAADIATARKWADDRSFDVSYFPGIDVIAARENIYNDLPPVSFERGEVTSESGTASDAVADEAGLVLAGQPTPSQRSFNLAPITEARPYYYDVLRLNHLPLLLRRIEMLPQAEIGPLVNVAVLAQAVVLALFVLAVPLVARRPHGRGAPRGGSGLLRTAGYFAVLGVGFLFIEITAIEKAAFFLNDRATAFALVLTSMLVFSGLGSLLSIRAAARPRQALGIAVAVIVIWCGALALTGDWLILACADWPAALRALLVALLMAPVSMALGLPFPLGLSQINGGQINGRQTSGQAEFLLPWAWALNGAFSVVATPLANLAALSFGLPWVLFAAMLLYALAYCVFPARKNRLWPSSAPA